MKHVKIGIAGLLISLFASTALAEDDPKNLKEVMQRLEANMSKIVGHIMREDFPQIAIAAEKIAVHDEPPLSHRLKLIAELGTDFLDFKSHDDNVHLSSVAMQEAAQKKDLESIITNYGKTLQNCNNCHKKYRQRIQKVDF